MNKSLLKVLPRFNIECTLNSWHAVCGIAISGATLITVVALLTSCKAAQNVDI